MLEVRFVEYLFTINQIIDDVLNPDIEERVCHVLNKHTIEKAEGKVSEKVLIKWILISSLG